MFFPNFDPFNFSRLSQRQRMMQQLQGCGLGNTGLVSMTQTGLGQIGVLYATNRLGILGEDNPDAANPAVTPSDPCTGIICPAGSQCVNGVCEGPCYGIICMAGKQCVDGVCVDVAVEEAPAPVEEATAAPVVQEAAPFVAQDATEGSSFIAENSLMAMESASADSSSFSPQAPDSVFAPAAVDTGLDPSLAPSSFSPSALSPEAPSTMSIDPGSMEPDAMADSIDPSWTTPPPVRDVSPAPHGAMFLPGLVFPTGGGFPGGGFPMAPGGAATSMPAAAPPPAAAKPAAAKSISQQAAAVMSQQALTSRNTVPWKPLLGAGAVGFATLSFLGPAGAVAAAGITAYLLMGKKG